VNRITLRTSSGTVPEILIMWLPKYTSSARTSLLHVRLGKPEGFLKQDPPATTCTHCKED